MAISDTQKTDYLFKKLGFGITKTDTNSNKAAANESIASPLLLRGDKVWQQASSIPGTKPSSTTGVTTVYTGGTTVECTADITASTNRTWKTGLTDWIPPEFGSTYLVNVYVHTASDAGNAESISNKVFITGSGNDDEWFFDYQSGVLHFIGDNLPNGVDFSGKSVYVAGARYTGAFGVGSSPGDDAQLGNLTISNVTITSTTAADDIILDAEDGVVVIAGTSGFEVPVGNTAQRPTPVNEGTVRWNSENSTLEVYNGSSWADVGTATVVADAFDGDDSTTAFTITADATDDNILVMLNGVTQLPTTDYSVSGNVITFSEAPATGDKIDVRLLQTNNSGGGTYGNANVASYISSYTGNITANNVSITNSLTVSGDIKSDSFYFVKRSTNTSISYPGSYGAVTIDYEDAGDDYNSTDAMWSSATDRFTPTVAGLWYIRASIDAYPGVTAEGGIFIEKNGTSIAQTSHIGFIRGHVTTHVYMNGSTDYLQFKAYTQGSTTRGQSAENSFFEALLVKQAE